MPGSHAYLPGIARRPEVAVTVRRFSAFLPSNGRRAENHGRPTHRSSRRSSLDLSVPLPPQNGLVASC
jgi:hypothetical protein